MPRYIVVFEVTSVEVTELYIDADSADEAEEKAEREVEENWPEDFEQIDSSTSCAAELLPSDHYVSPVSYGEGVTLCKSCDKPVRWTGTHVPGQPTIPGPWVHVEEK